MYRDEALDEQIKQFCLNNRAELSSLGPDFSMIEKCALEALRVRKKRRKTGSIVRIAVASVSAALLLNVFLLFADFQPVKAYQETIRKMVFNLFSSPTGDTIDTQFYKASTEISKVQQLVPYKIPAPGWVPAGYSFDNIDMRDDGHGLFVVSIKYVNGSDTLIITIDNSDGFSDTIPSSGEGGYEKVTVNGNELYIAAIPVDGKTLSKCHFLNKQGLSVYISGYIDKQLMLDIVETLQ